LPQHFSKDLHLSLQHSNTLSDSGFIVMASPVTSLEVDSTFLSYLFFPAHDSSGRLICTIPARMAGMARASRPFSGSGRNLQSDLFDDLFGISEYETRYYGNVSFMRCPKIMLESLTTPILMVPYLAEEKVKSLGLSFDEPAGLYEMMVGEFKSLSGADAPYVVTNYGMEPGTGKNQLYFQLNYKKMIYNDRVAICRQTAREFFYRVLAFYYSERTIQGSYLSWDHVWMHAAIGSWFEEWLPPEDLNFKPTGLSGNELELFDGLVAGGRRPGRNMRLHGYAEAPLIKYLVTHYRESVLNRIYADIAGEKHPAEALRNSMADPPRVWGPDFIRRYISGELYGIPNQTFLNGVSQSFQIRSSRDTLTSWSDNYPDISAKLYRIDLEYAGVPAGAQLQFAVSTSATQKENAQVMLFGINQGKLEYWTQGDTVNVAKIKDLTQAGYDILAVVNYSKLEAPYYRTDGITLDVRLFQPAAFTTARFKARMGGVRTYSDGSTWDAGVSYVNDYWHAGIYADNVFQAGWNITTTNPTFEGRLVVRLDANSSPIKLTYFEFHETTRSGDRENLDIISKQNLAIPGQVPYYSEGTRIFRIEGAQVCAALASLSNHYEDTWGGWDLTSFSCDDQSYVEIILQ
ncbi:hypothetical protein GX408_11080, partial [bacterium]|nr:hypothetical protein [bacterium]